MNRDRIIPEHSAEADRPDPRPAAGRSWPAIAVLVPTVPLLLGSLLLLLIFYLAPTRFNAFIERLPGDDLLRTILIFAPVTLFAVVVLALLYAFEQPAESRRLRQRKGAITPRRAAWLAVSVGLPLLVISVGVALLQLISPERLAAWLRPLPGDSLWRPFLGYAPVPPLLVLIAAGLYLFLNSSGRFWLSDPFQPARWGSLLTLLTALPLLLLSVAALMAFVVSPERVLSLIDRISFEALLRTALVFAPVILLSLVLLAALFLISPSLGGRPDASTATQPVDEGPRSTRAQAAVWVLSVGLGGTGLVVLALFGVMVSLVLR